jgi:hypothetical protein
MLTFNKDIGGRKIARVKGGKLDGEYLYLNINSNNKSKNEVVIKDGKLIPLPNKEIVEKVYISAPSGAGKSTWAGNYMKEYRKIFKDDEIYVFSSIKSDKALDRNDPIRITLDEDLIQDPIDPSEISNSLAVFDDTDTIQNARLKNAVAVFRDWLLEQGRHFDIRMLITSHLLSDYKHTRRILNEATSIVVFPKSGSGTYNIKRFLQIYCGFDKLQIRKFLNLDSRWVSVYRSYPQFVLYEKGAYLPEDEDFD